MRNRVENKIHKLKESIPDQISKISDQSKLLRGVLASEQSKQTGLSSNELEEMFTKLFLQFIEQIGGTVRFFADSLYKQDAYSNLFESFSDNINDCIGYLKSLVNAAATTKNIEICDALKVIQSYLVDVKYGEQIHLTENDLRNLICSFSKVIYLFYQKLSEQEQSVLYQRISGIQEHLASIDVKLPGDCLISEALHFYNEVVPSDVCKVYLAGFCCLNDIISVSAQHISEAANISYGIAKKIKLSTLRALIDTDKAVQPLPSIPESNLSLLESHSEGYDTFSGIEIQPQNNVTTLDVIPDLQSSKIKQSSKEQDRILNVFRSMEKRASNYSQFATDFNIELEKTYSALLELQVERERFLGELEFHREELAQFLDESTGDITNQDAFLLYKAMLQSLQQVGNTLSAAVKKMSIVHDRMENCIHAVGDLEVELSKLTHKKRNFRGQKSSKKIDEIA